MKEWLLEFAKTPVGIIVFACAGVIVLTIVILANTSFGRKTLKKFGEALKGNTESCEQTKKDLVIYESERNALLNIYDLL